MRDDSTAPVTVLVHLVGPLDAVATADLCERLQELAALGAEAVVCDAVRAEVDLALVDALARLHLAGRRAGCRVRIVGAGTELCELLRLVGLAEVLGVDP